MNIDAILSQAIGEAFGPIGAALALAAIGLNIHFGYTGLLNFGQVGFMLVGAYGVAVSVQTYNLPLVVGVLVGIGSAVILALLLGIPALRLRSDYLAISTIAAAEILRLFYRSSWAQPVTGGVYGRQRFADDFYAINPYPAGSYGVGPFTFRHTELWAMTLGWGLVALAVVLVYLLVHSPWGRVLRSIRDDEEAARSLGKNVYAYKLQALVLGGVLGACGGMVWVINTQSTHPDAFRPDITFFLWTMLILGGAARVLGPVLGAVLFQLIVWSFEGTLRQAIVAGYIPPEIIAPADTGAARFAFVGLGLLLLMIYRPQGILGRKEEMVTDGR